MLSSSGSKNRRNEPKKPTDSGYVTEGGAYDVGTPESYAEAQRAFRTMQDGSPG